MAGNPWWVIPEGFLGKLTNALISGPTLNLYTAVQSAGQPPGAVAGPYNSQAEAQAQAKQLNGKSVATLPNIAAATTSSVAGAVSSSVLGPLFQASIWLRVAEVVLGVVLIAVGVAKLTNAIPAATKIASVVK
jgi:hypothetical protein